MPPDESRLEVAEYEADVHAVNRTDRREHVSRSKRLHGSTSRDSVSHDSASTNRSAPLDHNASCHNASQCSVVCRDGIHDDSLGSDAHDSRTAKRNLRDHHSQDESRNADEKMQILRAAANLFADKGYDHVSVGEIVRASGTDITTFLQHFDGKDDILRFFVERARAPLLVAVSIAGEPGLWPEKLFAVLYADALMLCRMPFDFYLLEDATIKHPDMMEDLDSDFGSLVEEVQGIVDAGIRDGSFIECNSFYKTLMMLALGEGVQHRHHKPRTVRFSDGSARDGAFFSIFVSSDRAASAMVGHILSPDLDIDDVRANARKLGWIEIPVDDGDVRTLWPDWDEEETSGEVAGR